MAILPCHDKRMQLTKLPCVSFSYTIYIQQPCIPSNCMFMLNLKLQCCNFKFNTKRLSDTGQLYVNVVGGRDTRELFQLGPFVVVGQYCYGMPNIFLSFKSKFQVCDFTSCHYGHSPSLIQMYQVIMLCYLISKHYYYFVFLFRELHFIMRKLF